MLQNTSKQLVNAQQCIAIVFPNEDSAPCIRTFWGWKAKRWIPCVKMGKIVVFDPVEVRKAIDKKFTINAID
jgi:hypothetical protein